MVVSQSSSRTVHWCRQSWFLIFLKVSHRKYRFLLLTEPSTRKSNFPLVNGTTNSFTRRISTALAPASRPTSRPLFEPCFVRTIQRTHASPPDSVTRKSGDFFGGLGTRTRSPDGYVGYNGCQIAPAYVAALERNGFFEPDSWYMNAANNIEYAKQARDGGKLSLPALFLHGTYHFVCENDR